MLKILKTVKNPQILVVTPLLTGHKISGETKKTIQRNETPYIWVSWEGDKKHAANTQEGLEAAKKGFGYLPPYIFVLDRDIILGRNLLDRLFFTLRKAPEGVAYAFCPFEYKGYINVKFPPMEFNIKRLLVANHISSNSLYKTTALERIGGFVTDEDTHRLSDWATFLKLYIFGYSGILCNTTSFVAVSSKTDISAGSNEEFLSAKDLVLKRFANHPNTQK